MHIFTLLRRLIFRNIGADKFLTILSIIGVALGIGLFIGVKVASDRALTTFETNIQGINPSVNFEIHDISGIDFDESIFQVIRDLEEKSFPVIKTFGYFPDQTETLRIVGIDSIRIPEILDTTWTPGRDIERFYTKLNSVLLPRTFADSYQLKAGDRISAVIYDRNYMLSITGVFDDSRIPTNNVVMDIGNFQEYFGKSGYLTHIDLVTDEKAVSRLRTMLPANLRVEKKEIIFQHQKALVSSFRHNLQFVSYVAILAGFFLLYNTVFISVVRRRTEIGILRGLGTGKKTIMLLFSIQGLFLGSIGSIIGILFGQLSAYFSVIAVEKTISTMYSAISISDFLLNGTDILTAFAAGIIVSLCASLLPAFEASRIVPNETSREGSFEKRYSRLHPILAGVGLCIVIAGTALSYFEYVYSPFAFPILSYVGILFVIVGFTCISPFFLTHILKLIQYPVNRIFKAKGKLSYGDLRGNIFRFSVALMSVAISSALIVALVTLIFSFRISLKAWIEKNISSDVYIKPSSCTTNYCFYPMSEDIIDAIRKMPEVAGVDKFRALKLELFGKKVIAGFADIRIKRAYSKKRYHDEEYEATLKEMEGHQPVAGISDYLSIQYGLSEGDTIELSTPKGVKPFIINDVFSSYSTTSGFIYIDRKWLNHYWGLDDATQVSIYVKEGVDIETFISSLKHNLLPVYALEIMNNQELRDKIMDIFNKSFAITYAIEFISIIVSLIGVINTLLALVLEKKREISIVRYLGGSWRQIKQTLILSAGIVGASGILLGISMGLLMSSIFIHTVNKVSFGWKIVFEVPLVSLTALMGVLFLTTIFAGYLPSRVARNIDPGKFISFE
jgi:putative ABC transport system permease protein